MASGPRRFPDREPLFYQESTARCLHGRAGLPICWRGQRYFEERVMTIGKKRIDWNKVRAEYIGGASIRQLAEKHGVNKSTIGERCKKEHWIESRTKVADKTRTKAVQKTAEILSENATLEERIRQKLLRKLEREIDAMMEEEGMESRVTETSISKAGRPQQHVKVQRMRDAVSMFLDLCPEQGPAQDPNAPIFELIKKLDDECHVQ